MQTLSCSENSLRCTGMWNLVLMGINLAHSRVAESVFIGPPGSPQSYLLIKILRPQGRYGAKFTQIILSEAYTECDTILGLPHASNKELKVIPLQFFHVIWVAGILYFHSNLKDVVCAKLGNSCVQLCHPMDYNFWNLCPRESPGKNTGGLPCPYQEIFLT